MTTVMTREVIFIATYMSYARALRTALVPVLLL